jgi:hypothetical protein
MHTPVTVLTSDCFVVPVDSFNIFIVLSSVLN